MGVFYPSVLIFALNLHRLVGIASFEITITWSETPLLCLETRAISGEFSAIASLAPHYH
jgi:hypothetical protein